MKYAVDCEFIDTPEHSELISLAVVAEDDRSVYFEFQYPAEALTPWLVENVIPNLDNYKHPANTLVSFPEATTAIRDLVGDDVPEFWCYYGAYDWYWLCRVFGGFMQLPEHWGIVAFHDFAHIQRGVPNTAGAEHNALADAQSLMNAMRAKGILSEKGSSHVDD